MSRAPRGVARARRRGRGLPARPGARHGALLLLIFLAAAALWVGWTYAGPGPAAKSGKATTVYLERGSGLARISSELDKADVVRSALLFTLAATATGASGDLKAGEYEFPSGASMRNVLGAIRTGKTVRHGVTIPEGFTSEMAVEVLMRETALTGVVKVPPEGAILPATYDFQRGEARAAVLKRMVDGQTKLLAELWAKRQPGLPLKTPQEAVTLASIVEKETAVPAERPRIAAVFVNRLRKGMRLESDPTIIYGVTRGRALGRPILASEVRGETAWNTYVIAGLPKTPIANPGRESLAAVLNPPKSKELFFVADGTGGHVFAETFEQHQANVVKWRKIKAQQMAAGVR